MGMHAFKCDHQVDWNAGELVDVEQRWGKRCMLEFWHIHKERQPLNRDKGTLLPIYSILQQFNHQLQCRIPHKDQELTNFFIHSLLSLVLTNTHSFSLFVSLCVSLSSHYISFCSNHIFIHK